MISSCVALMEACARLAALLDLPLDLDPESDEAQDTADWQGQGATKWQRYGVESLTCLGRYYACRVARASRCALVFTWST
jgi:hypothetical protein